jgi:hypothetical protein
VKFSLGKNYDRIIKSSFANIRYFRCNNILYIRESEEGDDDAEAQEEE